MKRLICITLCMVMLLSLCACGSKTPHNSATHDFDTKATESKQAEKEESLGEVILYEDEYCAIVQTSTDYRAGSFDLRITNKTDGTLYCSLGDSVYINDIRMDSDYYFTVWGDLAQTFVNSDYGEATVVPPNETLSGGCNIYTNVENRKLGVMFKVSYDNGEVGVYNQSFEIVNDVFILHNPETAVTNRYVPNGEELLVMENEHYRIIGINCSETKEYGNRMYNISLYIENKTAEYETFYFTENINITSDRQDNAYYLTFSKGAIALAPYTGYYLTATFSKDRVDLFAKDISEIVTVTIPVTVRDCLEGSMAKNAYTWSEDLEIKFTRDQLVP